MKKRVANYIKSRIKSFKYAFRGIYFLFKDEPNAKVQFMFALMALILSWFLHISPTEWIVICCVICLVFAMEAINSAIENLSDFASNKRIEESIKKTKDLSAAAVLFTAIAALIAGLIVFLPKLIDLCRT